MMAVTLLRHTAAEHKKIMAIALTAMSLSYFFVAFIHSVELSVLIKISGGSNLDLIKSGHCLFYSNVFLQGLCKKIFADFFKSIHSITYDIYILINPNKS